MAEVAAATAAIITSGVELTTLGMLWCSASQYRWYPAASAVRASSSVSCSACEGRDPVGTGERSSTDSGIVSAVTFNQQPRSAAAYSGTDRRHSSIGFTSAR